MVFSNTFTLTAVSNAAGQKVFKTLLLEYAARANESGYHTAAISTWPHNVQALALYRKPGFAPIAPFKEHTHAQLVFLGMALNQALPQSQENTNPTSALPLNDHP